MLVLKEGAEVEANNPHECAIRGKQGRREGDEVRREVNIEKELKFLPDMFLVRSRHSLRRIFTYNRDDCLATWAVARWLLDEDQV